MGWEFQSMRVCAEERRERWSERLYRTLTVTTVICVVFLAIGGVFGA